MRGWTVYSPPFALFVPKLLPTTPVQRQDWPAALVHDAVAVAPTVRQVIARLSRVGVVETWVAKRAVRERLRRCMMGGEFVGSGLLALAMIVLLIVFERLFRCWGLELYSWNKMLQRLSTIFNRETTQIYIWLVGPHRQAGSYFVATSIRTFLPHKVQTHTM